MTGNGGRTALVLSLAAFAIGALIVIAAAFLPLVSVESSSASATAAASAATSADQSSTPATTPATNALTVSSQETLLQQEGTSVLATVAVPAIVSLVVAGLLLAWSSTRHRAYLGIAWALAGLLLAAAILALLTIGIFVLPVAGLLLAACGLASSPRPAPVRLET